MRLQEAEKFKLSKAGCRLPKFHLFNYGAHAKIRQGVMHEQQPAIAVEQGPVFVEKFPVLPVPAHVKPHEIEKGGFFLQLFALSLETSINQAKTPA